MVRTNRIMNKNFLLILLTIVSIISSCSSINMSNRAAAHYEEAYLASKVIKQIREDNPDYFYDVLIETDVYQEYIDYIYGQH